MMLFIRKFSFLLIFGLIFMNSYVFGAIINVPEDQKTIQSAINVANDGDTVIVAPGTYKSQGNVNVNFKGKQIVVKSQKGPDATIIDCGLQFDTRGFTFNRRENLDSILEGFTIKNGWHNEGGGIYINKASPTIRNCVITDNRAIDLLTSNGIGGGIYCIDSEVYLSSCIITNNRAGSEIGGGIYIEGDAESRVNPYKPIIYNCTISENVGGGVYSTNHVNIWLKESKIINNRRGSGVVVTSNMGNGSNHISNCIIKYNNGEKGAGILCTDNTILNISNCFIDTNFGILGGGIFCHRTSSIDVSNCLIVGNFAPQGAGIFVELETGQATIKNCTITENMAVDKGGGIFAFVNHNSGSVFTLTDSIVWGNDAHRGQPEIAAIGVAFVFKSCNIRGGLNGLNFPFIPNDDAFLYEDNIDTDPLFVDPQNGDYRLKPNSPAKLMGVNATIDRVLSVTAYGKRPIVWGNLKKK